MEFYRDDDAFGPRSSPADRLATNAAAAADRKENGEPRGAARRLLGPTGPVAAAPAPPIARAAHRRAPPRPAVAPAGTPPGCVSHTARRAGGAKKDGPLPRSVLGDVTHLFPGCGPAAGAGLAGGAGGAGAPAASAHAQASAAAARLRSMR
jgi:hypothetical protein